MIRARLKEMNAAYFEENKPAVLGGTSGASMLGIGKIVTAINPHWLYIKIAAVVALVGGLIWSGIWIRGVFAERDTLRASEALATQTTKMYADVWNRNQQLQREIVDAIKKIRVESNTYIDRVETSPPPVVPAGGSIAFIAPGVPTTTLPAMPGAADNLAGGTSAAAPPR